MSTYTYLVGTDEELEQYDGQEFLDFSEAMQYADDNDLSVLQLEWEFSDSQKIK